ncbi:MAG: hypothetical protein A2X49_12265 [Lentisphaerae bacterium GWF2_52_8]|nr:MAG: hypothetical protein A2X49_12265 [Lentisphaerae bacterium GWF2_52_8]
MTTHREKVLIVDDDHDIRSLIRRALSLKMPELEVDEAGDGFHALRQMGEMQPHVVLCDIHLPGCDGFAVLRVANQEHPDTKFIMFTGFDDPNTSVDALRMGASDYLRKPLDTEELIIVLRRTLAHRHAERELEGYHRHLSDLINEERRSAENSIKAEESERAFSELKTRFVAVLSHEFRTPLTVILTCAQLVRKYGDRLSPEERNASLSKIENAVKNMSGLIEGLTLLERTQSESFKLEKQITDLSGFCKKLLTEMNEANNKRHKCVFSMADTAGEEDFQRHVDIRLLRIILSNLLSNAFKYSPPGAEIGLRLSSQGNALRIELSDQGCGIPRADQGKIFNIFERAGNAGTVRGSGLGLYIAQQMATAHGATLSFSSEEGKGSTFVLEIPAKSKD